VWRESWTLEGEERGLGKARDRIGRGLRRGIRLSGGVKMASVLGIALGRPEAGSPYCLRTRRLARWDFQYVCCWRQAASGSHRGISYLLASIAQVA